RPRARTRAREEPAETRAAFTTHPPPLRRLDAEELAARGAGAPLFARLAPGVHRRVLEREGHGHAAQVRRAQLLCHPLRGEIVLVAAVDDLLPAAHVEGVVHGGGGAFAGVTLAPVFAQDAPAHFRLRPAFWVPRPEAAPPLARCLLAHREHGH